MKPMTAAAALAGACLLVPACAPVAIMGTTAMLGSTVVQERTTMDALSDTEIKLSILTGLGGQSGELFRDVSVDVIEGRVVLTGSVPRRDDKVTATRIAWETAGVKEVSDEITVAGDAGTSAYLKDVAISNRLRYELLMDVDVRSVNYNVETVDGVVHVTGIARSPRELRKVLNHASRVQGVSRVVSHVLTIDDPRRTPAVVQSAAARATPG